MILKAFSLLDMKAGVYSPPFFMAHAGQAIRACIDLGQDLNTSVGRHPADFSLVELGSFDDGTGELVRLDVHQVHGTVLGFLPRPQASLSDLAVPLGVHRNGAAAPHSDERA